jgi:chromosome partitioning protein
MKTLALYNMKGGVGKTATAVNLSYLAAADGKRVLLCDLDPQGSTSYYFRIRPSKKLNAKNFVKGGKKLEKYIRATDFENLDLLPADFSFRDLSLVLEEGKGSKKRLKDNFKQFAGEYDYIFFDTAPGLSLESENIFRAADIILIPIIPTTLSVVTLKRIVTFFKDSKSKVSRLYPFFSMADRRKKMHRDIMAELPKSTPKLLNSWIPYSSDVERMGIDRKPLTVSTRKTRAVKAYHELWEEIKKVTG